jgi:hypothetical membrane protein
MAMTATTTQSRQRASRFGADPVALARFTLIAVIVYVAIDVLLKFLRPSYSLLYNAESDYGRGPWYWVMDINFLLRCALSLAVAVALSRAARLGGRDLDGLGRGGVVLIEIWAVTSGLLAFFADNPEGTPATASGKIHLLLALIAFLAVTVGTVLASISLRADPDWRPIGNVLFAVSIAGVAAFLLLGTATGHKHAPGGLYERIFLGLQLLWIALAAGHIAAKKIGARPEPPNGQA